MIALLLLAAVQSSPPMAGAGDSAGPMMHRPVPPQVTGTNSCLPLKLADGMPVIEATAAGRKLSFGFDTGAPGSPLLDPRVIADLKLTQVGEARITDPSFRNVLSVPIYELRDLKVGNVEVARWTASARPVRESRRFADPDGIIGLTAFAGFIVTIDYPGGRLLLTKGRLPEPDNKTSFRYDGPIPRVPLSIEGKTIDAHLDTGNSRYPLILPESYAAQLAGYTRRFPIGIARTVNNTLNLIAFPISEARVGDMPLYAGTASFPAPAARGNIGSPLLKDMVVKVDPANSIVSLERAPEGLESGCPAS